MLKQMNKSQILQVLFKKSPLTKADVATQTQLTFVTVSNLITELQNDGFVREMGLAVSTGGRKPLLYGINPDAFVFAGIEVQVERLVCVLTDFENRVLNSRIVAVDSLEGPVFVARKSREIVVEMLEESNLSMDLLARVSVSTPGPIDREQGVIVSPPNMPNWRNVPFRDMIQAEFSVPCDLEKDANAAALGESRYGAGRGVENLIYIIVDVGIGGGIVLGGEVYRGQLNGAGEVGHTLIDLNGPLCNCGSHGCLESMASKSAIERELSGPFGNELVFEELIQRTDDKRVRESLLRSGTYLGAALANLGNIFNPEMIILGGELATGCTLYFERAEAIARRRMLPHFVHRVQIKPAELGKLSGAIGAATIAWQTMVQSLTF